MEEVPLPELPELREPQGLDGNTVPELERPPSTPDLDQDKDSDTQSTPSTSPPNSETPSEEVAAKPAEKRHRRTSRRAPSKEPPLKDVDPTTRESIFPNLIITEHSLRKQYIEVQTYRRKNLTFFWSVVSISLYLTYASVVNPSIYVWVKLAHRLAAITAYIVLMLFYLTGLYTKVFYITPQFIVDANKGLKVYNIRLVRTKSSWKEQLIRLVNPTYVQRPGGLVKIVPSPRKFSPHFIEDWEIYREKFWQREAKRLRKDPSKTAKTKASLHDRPKKERINQQAGPA